MHVIWNSATTSLLTYAEKQDKTKNLNQNTDFICKFPAFVTTKFSLKLIIKKKTSGLLVNINMQCNWLIPDLLLNMPIALICSFFNLGLIAYKHCK